MPINFKAGKIKNRTDANSRMMQKDSSINNRDNELNCKRYSATEKTTKRDNPRDILIINPLNSSLR